MKNKTEAQRRAWARYVLRMWRRRDEARKIAWIKSLYQDHILPPPKK
jgi:hypothetical protein